MTLRLKEIPAIAGDPFLECKLERKKYAPILTKIIQTYSDGFVLALNNKWGEGKTTFLKMFRLYLGLPQNGYQTLYFNAWEHDFNHDPLTAILSELKSLEIYEKQKFTPLIKKGAKLSKSLIPVFINAIAEKYVDTKVIKEAIKKLSEEAVTIFEEEINEYTNKKKGLEDFKIELEKYVSNLETKPLVFFIDELDRCNPRYAVEFLEIIKHFFSVPGIVFIVSIDKEQLSNSIKGYFGNENINTDEYLRRFFDLEYSLPKPETNLLVDWMFQKYNLQVIFDRFTSQEYNTLKKLSKIYIKNSEISIRQIEKLFLQIKLAIDTVKDNNAVFSETLFILILVKFFNNNLFQKIKNSTISTKDFLLEIRNFIKFNDTLESEFKLDYLEVKFAFLYSNNKKENYLQDIIKETQAGKYQLIYEPFFDRSENSFYSIRIINEFRDNFMSQYNLNYLIDKIELLDPLR